MSTYNPFPRTKPMSTIDKSPLIAYTGRLLNFLQDPEQERGILPMACTLIRPEPPLEASVSSQMDRTYELVRYCVLALKAAAGVNVHLDDFLFQKEGLPGSTKIFFYLDPAHKDFPRIETEAQKNNPTAFRFVPSIPSDAEVIDLMDSIDNDLQEIGSYSILEGLSVIKQVWEKGADTIVVDFSNLRPLGVVSKRAESSGPLSFAEIYHCWLQYLYEPTLTLLLQLLSSVNSNIRKGGRFYKNGALTTSLPCYHPDFEEYLLADPAKDHPWVHKGAVITKDWQSFYPLAVMDAVNDGSLWLEKCLDEHYQVLLSSQQVKEQHKGVRLLTNVCREILMQSKGTCMLLPFNLGQCEAAEDIIKAMKLGMNLLCQLHKEDHQSSLGIYLSAAEDKQVGLEPIGLANLLANNGFDYEMFTNCLGDTLEYVETEVDFHKDEHPIDNAIGLLESELDEFPSDSCDYWVSCLILGYMEAAKIAQQNGMYRAFCVAPTASSSYKHKDIHGKTTTPEISPPLSDRVERVSNQTDVKTDIYYYPSNVQTAQQVGFDSYFNLADEWQRMMDLTGLGHSISFNIWQNVDEAFMARFMRSNLKTTYYRLPIDTAFLDKSTQLEKKEQSCNLQGQCTSCDES